MARRRKVVQRLLRKVVQRLLRKVVQRLLRKLQRRNRSWSRLEQGSGSDWGRHFRPRRVKQAIRSPECWWIQSG